MSACMMHEVICKFKHWFIYRNYTKNEKCIGTRHTRLICVEFMYLDLIYISIYINIQSCHSEKCFLFAFINVPINFQFNCPLTLTCLQFYLCCFLLNGYSKHSAGSPSTSIIVSLWLHFWRAMLYLSAHSAVY